MAPAVSSDAGGLRRLLHALGYPRMAKFGAAEGAFAFAFAFVCYNL